MLVSGSVVLKKKHHLCFVECFGLGVAFLKIQVDVRKPSHQSPVDMKNVDFYYTLENEYFEAKNHKCLEDDFPFQFGDFEVPVVNFPGCFFGWVLYYYPHKVGPLPVINGVITPISRVK